MASTIDFSSPQMLALLQVLSLANPTVAPATGPAATGTVSPELQAFLDAIPTADDGHVITPDHHNSLKKALGRLAEAIDGTQLARVVTPSFTAALLPTVEDTPWRIAEGFSAGPTDASGAAGWMPLDLPDGTEIAGVTVRGKRPHPVVFWSAALRRVDIGGTGAIDVYSGNIQAAATASADGAFTADVPPVTAGASAAQLAERRRVDNSRYRYRFFTTFANAADAQTVETHVVQVTCTRT
jgi:hypothetical protein